MGSDADWEGSGWVVGQNVSCEAPNAEPVLESQLAVAGGGDLDAENGALGEVAWVASSAHETEIVHWNVNGTVGDLVLGCALTIVDNRERVALALGADVGLQGVVGNALVDRVVLSIARSVAEVLVGALGTVVVLSVALDAVGNGVFETYCGVVYWVLRDVLHSIAGCADEPSVDIQIGRVDCHAAWDGVEALL